LSEDLRAALQSVCATAPDATSYEVDWTRRTTGSALAVCLPASTAEVSAVLQVAARHGVGVTVAGGRTGLVAGAVPDATVVLSTERLTGVRVTNGKALAGAGTTLAEVQRAAAEQGWAYGVDMASRDSATIGGTVATNAGGLHVVGHGTTRAQVLGVEAVLADGSVVSRLHGLAKDATGYDLVQLLVGSEGTLAVVTQVLVRLVAPPRSRQTVLVPLASVEDAVRLVDRARREARGLRAAELLLAAGVELVRDVDGLPPLPPSPVQLLLEAEEGLEDVVPDDALVASDAVDAARLWAYRERMTEAIGRLGVPHKLDVSLPQDRLGEFVDALPSVTAGCTTHVFGHLGDGNLHVNVLGPAPDDDRVDDAVLRLAAAMGGSVGAEHGIGRAKRRWLHLSRTPAELAAMRAVKQALDPHGLLGPGVLLPDVVTGGGPGH
jgi:FAD/FMN-containing dehydrogenase